MTKYVYREKDFDIKEHVIALKPFWDEKILEMGVKKIPEDDYEYLDLVNSHPEMVQARINQFAWIMIEQSNSSDQPVWITIEQSDPSDQHDS